MPNAALIALTSPLLLGQAPEVALEPLASTPPSIEYNLAFTAHGAGEGAPALLAVSWTLAAAQTGPQETDTSEQSDPDDAAAQDDNQIVVEGSYGPPKSDPIERINEESYRITQELDEVFVEPVAYAYRDGLPGPIREGLGNFVNNLREPNNALNFLLQGKIGKTLETLGRFAINSTFGVAGLIDMAEKPGIGLPFRRNGFANTMGFYGVGSGAYLYLPLTGATSVRDVSGSFLDQLLLPVAVGKPFDRPEFTVPFYVVANLEDRVAVDAELRRIDETINPYAARRDSYLYRRTKEIAELRGEEPPEPPAILEEVEGTGDFADPPEGEVDPPLNESASRLIEKPIVALVITKPR